MADYPKSNLQKLFYDLSEAEQQSLISGQGFDVIGKTDFFFQTTNIESAADNDLNLGENESNSQSSKYKLSQINLGASLTFGLKTISPGSNIWSHFLPNILNKLFS
ncbi:hypothetical protein H6G06_11765 [Anabaena sphaerica FACHB-251]|uniref:Uncharacterized protein n=1 Tax=Anabaena sphaerica FACHB-251 TaxID=2692883 RepID=A0A926WJ71_9NOST|nr:hypothetical protein [Anabaena sphaerica]MBD2294148.1 hypothetical protein [Anabaena sphaerica FACHB-251]